MGHFNPLGRKTETYHHLPFLYVFIISIHSVARPRHICCTGRPVTPSFQSTRSQDRDTDAKPFISNNHDFNPLGRKTETLCTYVFAEYTSISIHSVARPRQNGFCRIYDKAKISIHSVARPRQIWSRLRKIVINFNPLGRKTETDYDTGIRLRCYHFNPLGRKTETFVLIMVG